MSGAVTSPGFGLMFDRPDISIPSQGLKDGLNFRIKNKRIESLNLGWVKFKLWTLDGAVVLIDNFFPRNSDERLIFGTARDLYRYDVATELPVYITPRYTTGTASKTGATVTGVGTTWLTNVAIGDMISFGSATENSPAATWFEIAAVGSNTGITLTTATGGNFPDGPYTIRKRFANVIVGEWSVDTFVNDGTTGTDLWIATNGQDPVVSWNGTDATVTLHPELGFTAKTLATFSNMMIYGNITQSGDFLPTTIINSDIGLPLNAGATGTGLSEQFVAHSNTDEILNLIPIGDYLVIYSERTIVPIQFIGDPLIFLFRVAISGVGPVSSNAIADFGDFHEFLGSDAAYAFDGVSLKEINSHVWRNVLRQADPARRRQVFAHFDEEQGDLIWSVPATTDAGAGEQGAPPEIAWPEHYLEDAGEILAGSPFSKRNFPFTTTGFYEQAVGLTWADVVEQWGEFNYAWNDQFFHAAFPLNLAGDENGQIWIVNQSQTADGAALPSFVHTGRFATRSGRERDLLTRVYPFVGTLPYNVDVTLYMGDFIGADAQNKGTLQYNAAQPIGQQPFVSFFRRGRVAELAFGSAAGEPWVLNGWAYDTVNGGTR